MLPGERLGLKESLWSQVKELEESHEPEAIDRLGAVVATLLVNYGPQGRIAQIIDDNTDTPVGMLVTVLAHLQLQIEE